MGQVFDALRTGAGMLWKALWALIFGYLIWAGIQVLVTRQDGERSRRPGTSAGLARRPVRVHLVSLLFAALAASRPVLVKGAEPSNALAFLIASTTLVIELGINGLTSLWFPHGLAEQAKRHAERAQQREGMEAVSTRARHCQLVEALAKVSRRPRRRAG